MVQQAVAGQSSEAAYKRYAHFDDAAKKLVVGKVGTILAQGSNIVEFSGKGKKEENSQEKA